MKKKFDRNELFITLLYLLGAIILFVLVAIKVIKTKSLDSANIETTILLVISLAYALYKMVKDKSFFTIFVNEKEISNEKPRRVKKYFIESLLFSVVMTFLDIISLLFTDDKITIVNIKGINNTVNLGINFGLIFIICMIISFGFEYLIGEMYMKKKGTNK